MHAGQAGSALRSVPSRSASVDSASGADAPCVEALDYARALRLLAVVLTDGSCALLRAAESGLLPVEQLQRLHWVCGPGSGALTARIGGPPLLRFDAYHSRTRSDCTLSAPDFALSGVGWHVRHPEWNLCKHNEHMEKPKVLQCSLPGMGSSLIKTGLPRSSSPTPGCGTV